MISISRKTKPKTEARFKPRSFDMGYPKPDHCAKCLPLMVPLQDNQGIGVEVQWLKVQLTMLAASVRVLVESWLL